MAKPKQPDRWDGWDDPNYQPTQAELDEPIALDDADDATPEDVARAVMRPIQGPTCSTTSTQHQR